MSRHHLQALAIAVLLIAVVEARLDADEARRYTPPATPRLRYSLDADWKFIRQDVPGAEKPDYDDREWRTVGLPHTVNEEDAFRHRASNGGDMAVWQGLMWYRKHFRIPRQADGGKVLLEVEGLRQAGRFFLNGAELGLYENGITPYGLDLTPHIRGAGEDNVLAVQVDNDSRYREKSSGSLYQWYGMGFYPMYGGLNRNIFLHVAGKVYQTLPLFRDLGTTGVYVYARNHDIPGASAEIVVELGLKVMITELDINVLPSRMVGESDGNPYEKGCPAEVLQRQAAIYGQLFSLFRTHADKISRVTLWTLHDGLSWLNWSQKRRVVNYPLLWDRELRPKPAFDAVMAASR